MTALSRATTLIITTTVATTLIITITFTSLAGLVSRRQSFRCPARLLALWSASAQLTSMQPHSNTYTRILTNRHPYTCTGALSHHSLIPGAAIKFVQ